MALARLSTSNEGGATAPSKRILKYCKAYDKPVHGTLIAIDIGLELIRASCGHFDVWVNKIEQLAV